MKTYYLTVYSKSGEALLNDQFEAESDEAATKIGKDKLKENGHADTTHRLVAPDGRLLLFHR